MTDEQVESHIIAYEGTGNDTTKICAALRDLLDLRRASRLILPVAQMSEKPEIKAAVGTIQRVLG
jgi:CRISPR/Cas system CMR-associated protein Cmr1 (group 7 of RAMP superfamily)